MTFLVDAIQIIILLYSVVLHEVAHGLAARALGDPTAERLGRLTLNPIKHLDFFGSIFLPIVSRILTGFMFGYAKPVPYNPMNLRDRRWGPSKVALAGPLTNIALAVIFSLVIRFLGPHLSPLAIGLAEYVVLINLVLAFFNLIPIPPLDGHWLLMAMLPTGSVNLKLTLYRYQWLFLVLVLFVLFPALFPALVALFHALTGQPVTLF